MGVHILHDNRDELAVLYCSTSDWAFGPVFSMIHGHGIEDRDCDECPHLPSELAEAFCDWFSDGSAARAAQALGLKPLMYDGSDPREWASENLERLHSAWRTAWEDAHEKRVGATAPAL